MEEPCNKELSKAKAKIIKLTSLVLVAEEKARQAKEAARLQGTHDGKASPSSQQLPSPPSQAPSSPPPPQPSQASTYFQ